eukprot:1184230-Prorocentrum_minimum.AAC.5
MGTTDNAVVLSCPKNRGIEPGWVSSRHVVIPLDHGETKSAECVSEKSKKSVFPSIKRRRGSPDEPGIPGSMAGSHRAPYIRAVVLRRVFQVFLLKKLKEAREAEVLEAKLKEAKLIMDTKMNEAESARLEYAS